MEKVYLNNAIKLAQLLEQRIMKSCVRNEDVLESLKALMSHLYVGASSNLDESNVLPEREEVEAYILESKKIHEQTFMSVTAFFEPNSERLSNLEEVSLGRVMGAWGFYEPEKHGERYIMWAGRQPSFSLTIHLDKRYSTISFVISDYLGRGISIADEMSIKVNGRSKYFSLFPIKKMASNMLLVIGLDSESDVIEIEFFASRAISPAEKENLSDERKLSICLQACILMANESGP
jgi:hypothetical protein